MTDEISACVLALLNTTLEPLGLGLQDLDQVQPNEFFFQKGSDAATFYTGTMAACLAGQFMIRLEAFCGLRLYVHQAEAGGPWGSETLPRFDLSAQVFTLDLADPAFPEKAAAWVKEAIA